jgi:hypothetical protein
MRYNQITISKGNEPEAFPYIEEALGVPVPVSMRRGLHLRK